MSTPINAKVLKSSPLGRLAAPHNRSRRPPNVRLRERLTGLIEAGYAEYHRLDQLTNLYGFITGREALSTDVSFVVLRAREGNEQLRAEDLERSADEKRWEWQIHAFQEIVDSQRQKEIDAAAGILALFRDRWISFNDAGFESAVLKAMLDHLRLDDDPVGAALLKQALASGDTARLRGVVAALLAFERSGMRGAPMEAVLETQLALLDPQRGALSARVKAWSASLKRIVAKLEREQRALLGHVVFCTPEVLQQERQDLQREREVLLTTSTALLRARLPAPMRELLNRAGRIFPQDLAADLAGLYEPDIEGMLSLLKDRASVVDALQFLWGGRPSTALRFAQALGHTVTISPTATHVLDAVEDALLDRLDLDEQAKLRYFEQLEHYPEGDGKLLRFILAQLESVSTRPGRDQKDNPILPAPMQEPRYAGLRAWIAEWAKASAPVPVKSSHPTEPPH